MRLELGGGLAPAPGHINIDIIPEADIIWDLNQGLPKETTHKTTTGEKFDIIVYRLHGTEGIRCSMLLEHLDNIIPLLNDCFDVMVPGALFEISVPYANTKESLQDPTHKRQFVEESFLYFCKDSPYQKEQNEYGITARFEIVKCEKGSGVDDWQLFVVLKKPDEKPTHFRGDILNQPLPQGAFA